VATYSAWDWNINAYRVYKDARPVSIGDDPTPPRPKGVSVLGAVPDRDVKLIPPGAKQVGTSVVAVGEIAKDPRLNLAKGAGGGGGDGLGSFSGGTSLMPVILVGVAVVAAVYFNRSHRRSR